jgi:hypothetical protein
MQVPLGLANEEVSLLHSANELLGITTYLDLLLLYVMRDLVQRFAGAAEEDVTLHHTWRVLAHQGQRLVHGTTPPNGQSGTCERSIFSTSYSILWSAFCKTCSILLCRVSVTRAELRGSDHKQAWYL